MKSNVKELERTVVCKKSEMQPGDRKVVQVRRISILVVRKEDEFYAVRNACPHQGAEFEKGVLRGAARATSEIKEVYYEKPGGFIYCPWHHWSFDVETGCSMHDPENTKIKTFEVKVEADEVVVYA
ncbi:nitrite reductase/ring-hydroxylating ferredoxin subunit [Neobacillus niacini]|uniref:Rieske (2Fe-2S) protein n=1 Tax=Neobacillus niacini TaxID=86668 RepID=UPI00104D69B3|nr:Rieske (2Fe-2S) protein [Neobacillus niacini]MDR7075951.1 nitrite reductase/ring-hydroxylating ferredoxin subunit [Neobacillus niacini]